MAFITTWLLHDFLGIAFGLIQQFWIWIVAGATAVLGFLFSPAIRKYSIAVIAILAIGLCIYFWGFNSNHDIQTITHTCDEFRKVLKGGPSTEAALSVFKKHGLCV